MQILKGSLTFYRYLLGRFRISMVRFIPAPILLLIITYDVCQDDRAHNHKYERVGGILEQIYTFGPRTQVGMHGP